MSLVGKLAGWWSARKEERREIEQSQADMRRAGDENTPPPGEILDEADLSSLRRRAQ
jgi:hypothetical protein